MRITFTTVSDVFVSVGLGVTSVVEMADLPENSKLLIDNHPPYYVTKETAMALRLKLIEESSEL